MAILKISGLEVILDDDIIDIVKNIGGWHVNPSTAKKCGLYYFRTDKRKSKKAKHKYIYLHRFITKAEKGDIVDHINRNTLDNTTGNLRLVNRKINAQNTKKHKKKSILPCGVRYRPETQKYQARITKDNKTYSLGCFDTPYDAYDKYKEYEMELYKNIRFFEDDDNPTEREDVELATKKY